MSAKDSEQAITDGDVLVIDDPTDPPRINFVSNRRYVQVRWGSNHIRLRFDLGRSGVGGILWSLALALPRYIELREKAQFDGLAGKSVLVLGAGLGFEGLVMALREYNAHAVYLTDLPSVLPTMRQNIEMNGASLVADRVHAHVLEWGQAGWAKWQREGLPTEFDLVIGCEIVYCEEALEDLKYTLQQVVPPNNSRGTVLYMAFESRYFSCLQFIRELALLPALAEDEVDPPRSSSYYSVESIADFDACGAEDAYIFRIVATGVAQR